MPIIRPEQQVGGWNNQSGFVPQKPWANDCFVQWGEDGIVFDRTNAKEPYRTAFFEAFPTDPRTFIRGEGETIAQAEEKCFAALERYQSCPGHEFEPRGYTNGAGICKHCRMFQSGVFPVTDKHEN